MITGKNKERFEEWYYTFEEELTISEFYKLPFEMQQGVLLAYYRSLNIECMVKGWVQGGNVYLYSVNELHQSSRYSNELTYSDYNEALTEAFKQADKLENEKLK